MVFITSLAPSHRNEQAQKTAVDSWVQAGHDVVSLNCPTEVESLRTIYPKVNFFETNKVLTAVFGKPYVSVKAIFEFAKEQGYDKFMLINSDIILFDVNHVLPKLESISNKAVIIFNRFDYKDNYHNAKMYNWGYDCMLIDKKFYHLYEEDNFFSGIYCLGQCWHDYSTPFRAMKKNIHIVNPVQKIFVHKEHAIQYTPKAWEFTTTVFQQEFQYQLSIKNPQSITSMVHRDLRNGFEKSKHLLNGI